MARTAEGRFGVGLRARMERLGDDCGGSSLIEVAVVLTVFFLLLLGIFEFAMLCTGCCSAAYSARQGARYASYRSNTSLAVIGSGMSSGTQMAADVALARASLFTPGATAPTVTVTYTNQLGASPVGNYVGNVVNVTINWTQNIVLPGYHNSLNLSVQGSRVIVR